MFSITDQNHISTRSFSYSIMRYPQTTTLHQNVNDRQLNVKTLVILPQTDPT